MSRTQNALKNTRANLILLMINTVLAFVTRIFFTKILGEDYLGLNSLITNIIVMLSLAELGIGGAINFSLYKPIANNDVPKIKALMKYYKKAYYTIGVVVIVLGMILLLFIDKIIPDPGNVEHLVLIFIICIINSAYSYFFTYKVTLIEASQKAYTLSKINIIFAAMIHILQLVSLLLTRNYIVYLLLNVGLTLIQRLIINRKINNTFSYLKEENHEQLSEEERKKISKNVNALVFHRIGDYCINGTDNILISIFDSIGSVGKYSNYSLLTTTVNSFIKSFFTSITSSVGNLVATEGKEKVQNLFSKMTFISFWLYGFSFICFFSLIDSFIGLVFGQNYVLDFNIVLVVLLNFYISGMIVSLNVLKDSAGVYHEDKYDPLIQSVINLLFSIILGKAFGILGIFLGTLISYLLFTSWHRPYIVYKHILKNSPKKYYLKSIMYIIIVIISALITKFTLDLLPSNSVILFGIKAILCLIISNLLLLIFTFKTKEFKELVKLLKDMNIVRKMYSKLMLIKANLIYFFKLSKVPFKVLNIEDSLDYIIENKSSFIRFGDGELAIIQGQAIGFQDKNDKLALGLKEVLTSNEKNLMICIPGVFDGLKEHTKSARKFWKQNLLSTREDWYKFCKKDRYLNAFISRPYIEIADKQKSKVYFQKLRSLYQDKDVILIEGKYSRLGVGNDLFDNVKSLKRILCPTQNAFEKYEEIFKEACKNSKNKIILLSLGPTAKILAYNLYKEGYQVLDIGHIDLEYEWYLQGATKKVQIKNKFVNEVEEKLELTEVNDEKYQSQIIKEIKND